MKTLAWSFVALVATLNCGAEVKVEEQVVGPAVEPSSALNSYVVSPRGVHLATVAPKGSRVAVVVDGVEGPKCDEICPIMQAYIDPRPLLEATRSAMLAGRRPPVMESVPVVFSKDGKRFAYVGRQGQEWVLMVDGKELLRLPAEGSVSRATVAGASGTVNLLLEFTGEEGKHLMLARSVFGGYQLWVDGQKMPGMSLSGGGTEGTLDPVISRDGAHFAYIAQLDREKRTVIRDAKDAGYLADNLAFTADGQHLLGISRQGGAAGLVVDGKLILKADGISQLVTAPAGDGFAAALQQQNPRGEFLVVNGKKVEGSDCDKIIKVVFSPDGKRYAVACKVANNIAFVIVAGKKGQNYDGIWQPEGLLAFSPDSSKLAYVAQSRGMFFVVVNEEESEAFDANATFIFSPDGKRVAVCGHQRRPPPSNGFMILVDGKAERADPQPRFDTFQFSPDSSHYAYAGLNGIVLDGKSTGVAGQAVGTPFTFSPDGKHFAIKAGTPKLGVYVDGQYVYGGPGKNDIPYRAFTPDGQHLFWTSLELSKPGVVETVTYLDGKPVARCDRLGFVFSPPGNAQFAESSPAWTVGSDGALTFVGPSVDVVKRFRITPSADTSLATMLSETPAKTEAATEPSGHQTFKIKKDLTPAQAQALEKWKALNAVRAKRGLPELPPPRDLREE